MLIMTTLALLASMGQQQGHSWDLAKCRDALTEGTVERGHVCTPEHLDADYARLLHDPILKNTTPEQARAGAEAGVAELSMMLSEMDQANKEREKERERAVAALDPELKGDALRQHCEYFVRAESDSSRDNMFQKGMDMGSCWGYVGGVYESLRSERTCPNLLVKPWVPGRSVICVPEGVTYVQVIRVVVKFLQVHPERLHEYRLHLVQEAIKTAFPCPSS